MTALTNTPAPATPTTPARSDAASAFVLPADGVDLRDVERALIEQALFRCHGNQTQAARLLRISRFALRSRMKKFDLQTSSPAPRPAH